MRVKKFNEDFLNESSGDKKELWYVVDDRGSVKNISTDPESANNFLFRSLKNVGGVMYVEVPLEDWNAEKVTVSTIKNYAKKQWQ